MREIKFRVWDNRYKKMFNWEETVRDRSLEIFTICPDFVLMQFTGLKDKNGKEIYEGDIVQPTTMNDGNLNLWTMVNGESVKKKVEIKWNEQYADFEIQIPTSDLEVIGNIYETPELLKGL